MADMSSMNRENKKKQLRRQIVSSDSGSRPPQNYSEDAEDAARKVYKKVRMRRLFLLLLLLLLLGAGTFGWFYYQKNYEFGSYETAWTIDMKEGSLVGYESFGNNVLKVTRDGASYIDNKGKTIWTESYEMKNPIVSVKGNYAAIADRQSNSIYICNTDGTQGSVTTVLPVSRVAVSGTGSTVVTLP